jgi:beta-phosphoglucomutase-like phosphatase (HAD superfamily)
MLTVLWDNDGVLVDTEGMYFQACQEVLGSAGIDLTLDQFKDISLRRGESTLVLAIEQGVDADTVSRLRQERDRVYAELLKSRCPVIDGVEEVLRSLHSRVRMGGRHQCSPPAFRGSPRKKQRDPAHGFCVDSGGLYQH